MKQSKKDTAIPTLDTAIRKGIPYSEARSLKAALALTDKELADCLGISLRALQQKRNSRAKLSTSQGNKLLRTARIFALATAVLEDEEMARRWLHREQRGLGGRVPIQVIRTKAGAQEVEDLLGQIEHSVLS